MSSIPYLKIYYSAKSHHHCGYCSDSVYDASTIEDIDSFVELILDEDTKYDESDWITEIILGYDCNGNYDIGYKCGYNKDFKFRINPEDITTENKIKSPLYEKLIPIFEKMLTYDHLEDKPCCAYKGVYDVVIKDIEIVTSLSQSKNKK